MILSGTRRIRSVLVAVAALGMVILASCSSSAGSGSPSTGSAGATGPTVTVKSLMFMPRTLHITTGTTVTWVNDEPITHTITSGRVSSVDKTTGLRSGQHPDGRFDKKLPGRGDSFSYTFTKPGTYPYFCDIHFGMNAQVVVT